MRLILLTSVIAILAALAQAAPPEKPARDARLGSKKPPAAADAKNPHKKTTANSDRTAAAKTAEDRKAAARAAAARKRAALAKTPLTRDRENAALRFARSHHRELAKLLYGLKKTDPQHYLTAVRELARDSERLGKLEQRGDDRYDVSLRIWKLDSRIRLEAARFSMGPSDKTESKLRELMLARQDARLEYLNLERDRSQSRVSRLDEQIETLTADSEKRITAEIDRLRRSLAAKGRTRAQSSQPRSKKPTTSVPTVSVPTVRNASSTRAQPPRKETPKKETRSKDSP